jgi:hypothetical protein
MKTFTDYLTEEPIAFKTTSPGTPAASQLPTMGKDMRDTSVQAELEAVDLAIWHRPTPAKVDTTKVRPGEIRKEPMAPKKFVDPGEGLLGKKFRTGPNPGHDAGVRNDARKAIKENDKQFLTDKDADKPIQVEVAPPGWSGTVKAMKKHGEISNPFALAWWMKNKGDKPHHKPEVVKEDEFGMPI